MHHLTVPTFALFAAFLLTSCERAKTKLDQEVDRLCALDGGARIYETVKLPKENFGSNGEVFPQFRHLYLKGGHLGPDYFEVTDNKLIADGDAALQRTRVAVVRKADGKVMAEFVDYKRSGGDFPGPWEPSRKSCPQSSSSGDFYQKIFIKEGT